jgi:hypothetical protein
MIPAKKIVIANALIKCMALRLKLVGLLGSFFLKKYMVKYNKKRGFQFPGTLFQVLLIN